MDTIAALQQLDQECTSWANQHAHSCNLLASLINITRQREQTLAQWQQHQQHQTQLTGQPYSRHDSGNKKPLLASTSLQLLVYKQTTEIESIVYQLYDIIQLFKKALQGMTTLERQMEAAIHSMDTSKLLNTLNSSPSITSRTDSKSSIPMSELLSDSSLLDTAEISPLEALDWISRIRAMYTQELNVKQAQIHPSMTSLDRFETLVDLQRNWGLQKRIDFSLEQEIVERIKAYRRVREFSSRA
ncbi:hypothetical protein BGZ54_009766 [Gamsiella multidivaricata]|nr:hypothetical protein BGZ54_009766 [Gamsiella multidivaricata]